MDYPIHIDTISMQLSIFILRGCQTKFLKNDVFLSLRIVFIQANSADPVEMLPYAAFHLGLHCLHKYLFTGIQNEKETVLHRSIISPMFMFYIVGLFYGQSKNLFQKALAFKL